MWEKFKMEVFNTSFYNEREGFTPVNIKFLGEDDKQWITKNIIRT